MCDCTEINQGSVKFKNLAEKIKYLAAKAKHKQKRSAPRRLKGSDKFKNLAAKVKHKQKRSAPRRLKGREKIKNLVLKKYRPKWKPTHIAHPPTMPGPISRPCFQDLFVPPDGGWDIDQMMWKEAREWYPKMIQIALNSSDDLPPELEEVKAKANAANGKRTWRARSSQEQAEYDWYHVQDDDFVGCPFEL